MTGTQSEKLAKSAQFRTENPPSRTWFTALVLAITTACAPAAPTLKQIAVPAVPEGEAAVRGPSDAPVTIVEFSDFECPYCARVQPILAELDSAYAGKLRFVFKHKPLPNHKNAKLAAFASMAAQNQGRFWEYRELLFKNQRTLGESDLFRFAEQLKLDMEKFKADTNDPLAKARLSADDSLAIKLAITGTPSFLINGRVLTGAQPFDQFRKVIDEELNKAETMLSEGVSPERLSALLTEMNRKQAAATTAAAGKPKSQEKQEDPTALFAVGTHPQHIAVGGSEQDTLVTMVVFTDYQCPFCSRLEPTLTTLREKYGNQLRIVFRNNPLPFHKDAMLAAQAALAANDQGKGWEFHQHLMNNQKTLDRADLDRAAMIIGLDIGLFRLGLNQNRYQDIVKVDMTDAQALGARGTPTAFINGKKVVGSRPTDAFVQVIDAELERAKNRAKAMNLSGRALYDSLVTVP
ncbi:MAG: thioredoxin domain-containing protein [Myxococcales bacterium]|nr:thioredoxin domain-containing protein [Myxococcales bacterium]